MQAITEDIGGNPSGSDIAVEDVILRQSQQNVFVFLNIRFRNWLNEIIDDFSEVSNLPEIEVSDLYKEPFNPLKAKKNLLRIATFIIAATQVYRDGIKLTRWENPPLSLFALIIYMIIIYKDWFLTVLLLASLAAFFFTYLRYNGWSVESDAKNFGPPSWMDVEREPNMKEKIQIMVFGARTAQHITGYFADQLEKIRNVLLWREPEITAPFTLVILVVFLLSLLFPVNFLVKMAFLGAGVYGFVLQNLFIRFPLFGEKYDFLGHYLAQLKTDAEYETKIKKIKKDLKIPRTPRAQRRFHNSSTQNMSISVVDTSSSNMQLQIYHSTPSDTSSRASPSVDHNLTPFQEKFNLPPSESALPEWENGLKCALVKKGKYLRFRYGKMYFSNHYLCFERNTSTGNNKNIVVPLETTTSIVKAKLYQWLIKGRTIEITAENFEKPLIFMFQTPRNEAYNKIMEIGVNNDYVWARSVS